MPEIPELVYQSLQQSKQLQTSVDTIVRDFRVRHVRQGQSRYLFGIGAVLLFKRYAVIYPPPGVGHDAELADGRRRRNRLIGWRKTR